MKNLELLNIAKIGPQIENNALFPEKTNIEFVQIENKNEIHIRIWERGVGETLACGTGACASVVASVVQKQLESKIMVNLRGGKLQVEWNQEDKHLLMTGPVNTVFDGKIYLKE
ncbi:MAG: hypothetical protein OMM_14676 [Candidatus Magnetoglobus multicellularis str. Araruama]|uniref:Diaminopimelate epimerase n=1 Tax=Candidatus Magnetoglobus multicellularis str. Araruama TaxID=890399 RepID=A0A1V1NRF9_9BACT|nr:MAG: hypothetical protein OMM_14676 [Candidatus Magnetoglobus multicellularis str. Araruama]